ncbi:DUF4148 domain-containing protein [Paraburkholderia hospita]|nr:DUF4148 domain-containing protein [Paraburkholderia hospita]
MGIDNFVAAGSIQDSEAVALWMVSTLQRVSLECASTRYCFSNEMEFLMASRITIFAAAVFFTGAAAHAQSTQSGAASNPGAEPHGTAAVPAAQWTPSYGSAAAGKTRAQVYQDLVARRSGGLDRLNRTLYAHH